MIIEFFFYVFVVGAVIAALAYFGDRFEKEPLFRIFTAILLGITSSLIIVVLHRLIPLPEYASDPTWGNTILVSYISAGFLEELAKFMVILGFIYKWDDLNEWYDGPLYAGLVGIGFSLSENLGYMLKPLVTAVAANPDLDTNIIRLLALKSLLKYRIYPGHFLFGFIAGYFIAKAKFHAEQDDKLRERLSICTGFIVAIVLHGTFNVIALQGNFLTFLGYVLALIVLAFLLGWKSVKKSVFRQDILEKLPLRRRNRLKEFLLVSQEEKITFGYVFLLCILIIVYQFFVFIMTYVLLIL